MKFALKSLLAAALAATAVAGQAAVVPIDSAAFVANAGQITFTGLTVGTLNPTIAAAAYGGTGTAPDVSFGSFFVGQSLGAVGTDCPAGTASGACIIGSPTGSLALDLANGLGAVVATDTSHSASPVLSGSPFLNGSIAMLFSTLQAGISFDAGFFNAIGAVQVTAYGSNGAALGSVRNTTCGSPETVQVPGCTAPGSARNGIESIILGTNDGAAQIAGLLISLVAPEQAGFTIDNISFGTIAPPSTSTSTSSGSTSSNGGTNQTPEPTSMALVGLALITLALARRRRSNAAV
ncbi:MAG: PEP-CTERM sorting domain-containing protein [Rubrivivax sp.]